MKIKLTKIRKYRRAYSSITAAIVLIAFVLVAASFAAMTLRVGIFAIDRSQESINNALEEGASLVVLDGKIYGYDANGNGDIETLEFTIRLVSGSSDVVIHDGSNYVAQIIYRETGNTALPIFDGNNATYSAIISDGGPTGTLSPGEVMMITIIFDQANGPAALAAGDSFIIDMHFEFAATLSLSRTIHSISTGVNNLG
ncbi:MAG: hypothetical protein INQ03_15780 [Candidatus Heimdallarchaeota archaeon]|nr:hypothetical protein [Candidatus Heimdallarchaeota archaeon]